MKFRKHTLFLASALLAMGLVATASAKSVDANQTFYKVHVKITKADKTLLNDLDVSTASGQEAPFDVTQTTPYVSSISSTKDDAGKEIGQKKEIAYVTTGLKARFTPVGLPDGRVMLEFRLDLSSLDSMQHMTAPDGSTIDLPTVSDQNFDNHVVVALDAPLTLKVGDKVVAITVSKQ